MTRAAAIASGAPPALEIERAPPAKDVVQAPLPDAPGATAPVASKTEAPASPVASAPVALSGPLETPAPAAAKPAAENEKTKDASENKLMVEYSKALGSDTKKIVNSNEKDL